MSFVGWQSGWSDFSGDLAAIDTRVTDLEGAVGSWSFLTGAADPTAGAGVAATRPALYHRSSDDTYYSKTGSADTAWTQLVTATFAGNLTVARLIFSGNNTAALPSIAWPDGQGFYAEAASMISAAVGSVRYWRTRAGNVDVLNAVMSGSQYLVVSGAQNTQLSATTNDLALTSVGMLRLTTSGGAQILTSITGGTAGRKLLIENVNAVGGDNVTLQHDNTVDGTAANRISLASGANLAITPQGAVLAEYDGTLSRWVVANPA